MNSKLNIDILKNSLVHDYELKDIIICYERYLIEIHLLSPRGENFIKMGTWKIYMFVRSQRK